uniref:Protein regulator of cytokinesis 1 n=1 Tax=Fundulus heteroclitus TaxID=8078 RepID=A0A3Q2QKD5_FUNHE
MRVSEAHAAESVAYFNTALGRLQDIWEEIGIPEEQRLKRTNDVHKHIKVLLDMMIAEDQDLKQQLQKSIESCQQELRVLCGELQLPPFEEEEGCTILQMEKNCRTRVEVMKEHKRQRMEELEALVAKDRELCDIMCTAPFSIDQNSVPSVKQLKDYRAYLDHLTKEKELRHSEFVSTKEEIIACMNDLERHPETSFEMDVMCENEDAFYLSNDNIAALKLLLSQLQRRKAENELLCSRWRTQIKELWERLQVPQEEREAVAEHMVNSKKKNIEALQAEVERLEVLKMQSMKSVIEAIRAEIAVLWTKCFYSNEQQQAFSAYHDEDFTEELLGLHEAEVGHLKKYYEDHKELFEGVTKWQENWNMYLELDRKANDPSRFTNRGGNLLKEEKRRAELQKGLPKFEKTLKVQIDSWEQEHNKNFLVNGQNFLEYVAQQWKDYHDEKEREKLERQLKKTKQTQEDMLYGTTMRTPTKRRLPGNPTPGKMRKINSSSTPSSFLNAGHGGTMCHTSTLKLPPSASKSQTLRTPARGKTKRALDQNKENFSHIRNAPCGPRSQDTQDCTFTFSSVADSYSEFARDLTTKAAKSTVMTGLLNSTVSHQ